MSILGAWTNVSPKDLAACLLMPNSIKKFGAVSSLFFGCCDRTSPAVGPLVSKNKVWGF